MFIIKITGYFTIKIINGHIGGSIRPKAILVRTKKKIFLVTKSRSRLYVFFSRILEMDGNVETGL